MKLALAAFALGAVASRAHGEVANKEQDENQGVALQQDGGDRELSDYYYDYSTPTPPAKGCCYQHPENKYCNGGYVTFEEWCYGYGAYFVPLSAITTAGPTSSAPYDPYGPHGPHGHKVCPPQYEPEIGCYEKKCHYSWYGAPKCFPSGKPKVCQCQISEKACKYCDGIWV